MNPERNGAPLPNDQEAQKQGRELFERGGIRFLSADPQRLKYLAAGSPRREITLPLDGSPECTCGGNTSRHPCAHVEAALLLAKQSGALGDLIRRRAVQAGPALLSAMDSALPEAGTLRMELTLLMEEAGGQPVLRAGIRVGEERLYVVRSIPQFVEAIHGGEPLSFGKGFVFNPQWMRFTQREMRVLEILRGLCLAQQEAGMAFSGAAGRTLRLPEPFALQLLEAMERLPFRLAVDGVAHHIAGVSQEAVPVHYTLTGSSRGLTLSAQLPPGLVPLTGDCQAVYLEGRVLRLPPAQRRVMAALLRCQVDGRAEFDYPAKEAPRVLGELAPFLKLTGVVELDGELQRRIRREPLSCRLYLDREGPLVVARTVFAYGETEIDPFKDHAAAEEKPLRRSDTLLMRDAAGERRVLDALAHWGFHIMKGRVYLQGQEAIYLFFTQGLSEMNALCQVYASQDFRRMTPRRPLLNGAMRLAGSQLVVTLQDGDTPLEELLPILEALRSRRKYFRLKDGSFLDLGEMGAWEEFADTVVKSARQEPFQSAEGEVRLQAFRMLYLSSLLKERQLPVAQDESVIQAVDALRSPDESPAPQPVAGLLRPYQRRGFEWLRALHRLGMGGVLADDMGLGKTIQVIALLAWAKEQEGGAPALVVSPTSLTYNWQAELSRFAPKLRALVMGGSQAQRSQQLQRLKSRGGVDVVITSYPLIRRDIDQMTDISFRFVILDEAQHIKNASSVGAAAVKQLNAGTRLALTGTPMENNAGELWSIFDFVLPGYLGNYSQFIHRYGEGKDAKDLNDRLRPFLMRRLKKDVLTDLPDKMETTLLCRMPQEQSRVYEAALLRLRARVDTVLQDKGVDRGRAEVLSAITELRQICCHPALCLPDYSGSSGKLELLLDVLPGAVEAGRRVLIFSQFTAMLKILRRHLEAEGYDCLYLDGETPAPQRLAMAESFNGGRSQVFLISLKAGGTGLNLTGADMVIHYDPWWNPAAEDQATDRAHRIGQTRKVEVIRLITHDSIEEQVVKLGQKKRTLFDRLVTAGEQMPTKLSEADIRGLFR